MGDRRREWPETYLGDGVYATFDGYLIWLDTRAQEPINRIALDPAVLEALREYDRQVRTVARVIAGREE